VHASPLAARDVLQMPVIRPWGIGARE